jgi:antitoxin (DNA-binding transcriptional repressor) of toxin-antitoxin stability system
MEKATISQIKNHFSAYLQKVRAGESVLILDRNQPVARLERLAREAPAEDRLTRLERDGLIRRARQPMPMEFLRSPAPTAKQSVLAALLEERQEGR